MARVEVSRHIAAPPETVWAVLADLAGHVSWMEDARAITFTTRRRSGVGTEFDCHTVIGPVRLVDHMAVTEWTPPRSMAIRHVKPVTGTGRITLEPRPGGGTIVSWSERLRLPWWLGGPAGGLVAARVLDRVWSRSLERLERLVLGTRAPTR
ncbi:MAG: SRPBCC family protein [Acidimicrobiales bacterium]